MLLIFFLLFLLQLLDVHQSLSLLFLFGLYFVLDLPLQKLAFKHFFLHVLDVANFEVMELVLNHPSVLHLLTIFCFELLLLFFFCLSELLLFILDPLLFLLLLNLFLSSLEPLLLLSLCKYVTHHHFALESFNSVLRLKHLFVGCVDCLISKFIL